MLQISNLYRVQLLLGKIKETEMHAECAILYGKVLSVILHVFRRLESDLQIQCSTTVVNL